MQLVAIFIEQRNLIFYKIINQYLYNTIMAQTRIDQFYKITSNSKKHVKVKHTLKTLPDLPSPIVVKKKGNGTLKKSKTHFVYENNRLKIHKATEKHQIPQDNNILLSTETCNLIKSSTKIKTEISPTTTYASPIKNQEDISVLHSNPKYSLKKPSSIKCKLDMSQKWSSQICLWKDQIDELIFQAVSNMNLVKEGSIVDNNFDLEKVYSSRLFNYKYNPINTTASTKYEIDDVVIPTEIYSRQLFLAILTVLSNPVNCGYFEEDELNLIFTLLTISKSAQTLLVRMLKRKHKWQRICNIKYDEISKNLRPIFEELVSRSIFTSSIEKEDILIQLNLLHVNEIRKLCKKWKISVTGNKEHHIQLLLKICNTSKSLFPGMQSPATKLCSLVSKMLDYCILLNTKIKEIVDKIITLLIPNRDPTETLENIFHMLVMVNRNDIQFPKISVNNFPIFTDKAHLSSYIVAKNTLCDVLNAIEKKQWQIIREFGYLAEKHLSCFLVVETKSLQSSTLPRHIRRFMPGYIWLKALSKSIDAFKKTKETMPCAIKFLQILINQNCHMQNKKGQWYIELIKIHMHHMKNFDISATLLSNAILHDSLTEVDKLDLLIKAERLVKRKSGVSKHTKESVKVILDDILSEMQLAYVPNDITIKGTLCRNVLHKKSTWQINNDIDNPIYGTVEELALHYYKCEGYLEGIHCEGAFPITLFAVLFWNEIYNIDIPGTCVSVYQDAPMDLYSSEFYENRKKQIDMKLQIIQKLDSETLSRHLKHEFDLHCGYKSLFQNIFINSNNFQEVVFCLGTEGVVGICKKLILNFSLWKAGFPDLIVWNAHTRQYKIVEVKGPGDSLSTKQKLWLEYLCHLGLNAEVCYCKSNTSHRGKT